MITHGKKQISEIVYARKSSEGGGAVRLTNIIRGAQVVFGGTVGMWLKYATRAAILAAFGQTDGKAVIKATNAYLNGISATDPNKATALAGFINEDPMLVCSLGLQPQGVEMPIRWLVGDKNAYIDALYYSKPTTKAKITYKCDQKLIWAATFGARNNTYENNAYSFWIGWRSNTHCYSRSGNEKVGTQIVEIGKIYKAETDGLICKIYKGDTLLETITSTGRNDSCVGTWFLFSCNKAKSSTGKVSECTSKSVVADFEILEGMESIKHFVVYKDNCMIDLNALGVEGKQIYYRNANTSGSFSIEYTLPDGTPWTPLNQTP